MKKQYIYIYINNTHTHRQKSTSRKTPLAGAADVLRNPCLSPCFFWDKPFQTSSFTSRCTSQMGVGQNLKYHIWGINIHSHP